MAAHVHAGNMKLFAEDAAQTNMPWERWQYIGPDDDEWINCAFNPSWHPSLRFRRKPIKIGGIEVPEPVRNPLPEYTVYWVASTSLVHANYWSDNQEVHKRHLKRGLIHLTKEAADAHARALVLASGGEW